MDVDSADANNGDGDHDENEDNNDGLAEGDDSASENVDDVGMLED